MTMLRLHRSGSGGGSGSVRADAAADAQPASAAAFASTAVGIGRKPAAESSLRRLQEEEDGAGAGTSEGTANEATSCQPCICPASGDKNATATASSQQRLKLRFLVPERSFARLQVMLSEIAEDYERKLGSLSPEITVSSVPTLTEMEREIKFDVLSGAGQFDGYIMTPLWIGELARGLYELTDFIKEYSAEEPDYWTDILLFYREVISSYDNKLYLFPFDGDVISMFYRRDLLKKHGKDVPKTWDEYNELARYFHGMTDAIYMPDEKGEMKFVKNVTLSGSCIGRTPGCGLPYWAQTVLATMTQVRGTAEGSLLDSSDLSPLLGPALEETLRLLGEQTKFGSPDEFDGCVGVHVERMNAGECVLTYNWGNSFSDHVRPGSTVRGKLGVAPTPGSPVVLNRETGQLEDCSDQTCPYALLDDRTGRYINQAPYGAYGGFSGAVSASVSPEHQRAAAEFFAFATSSKKAIKYVIPDANNPESNPVPTGMDPYAKSMLVVEEWTSRGFEKEAVEEYKYAIESQLGSDNVVIDLRMQRAADYMATLDDVTFRYCNATKFNDFGRYGYDDALAMRAAYAKDLASQWKEIEKEFDSAEGRSAGSLLQLYQRDRGVYVPPEPLSAMSSDGNGEVLSTGAIVAIVVSAAVVFGAIALLFASFVVLSEKRKREAQWYVDPSDVHDTKEILGRGSFGVVTKGFLRGTPVALKHPKGWEPGSKAPQAQQKITDKASEEKAGEKPQDSPQDIEDDISGDEDSLPYPGSDDKDEKTHKEAGMGQRVSSLSTLGDNALDDTIGASLLTEASASISPFKHLSRRKKKQADDSLRTELLLLIKLRHDNIVQTLGATIFDSRKKELVLVLQYMENGAVRSVLKDPNGVAGTAGMSLELQWAVQVARGVGFLHSVSPPAGPMLHNDLKSSNVLLDGSYNAHISDFGLATRLMGGLWGALRSSASRSNNPRGSLLWMAPEILNGADPTPASDVYSYSMFLVELMTRARPYGVRAFDTKSGDSFDRRMSELSMGTEYDRRRMSDNVNAEDGRPEAISVDDKSSLQSGKVEKRKVQHRVSWSGTLDADNERTESTIVSSSRPSAAPGTSDNKLRKPSWEFYALIDGEALTRDEIVARVKDLTLDPPFRPTLPDSAPQILVDICTECWHKNPKRRPTMKEVEERLSAAMSSENVTQQLMRRGTVFDSILPPDVQDQLAKGQSVPPKSYEHATVIFSDIVGFTNISSALTAEEVGDLILRLFTKFDDLCRATGVKKLDVIGDAFLGVAGVPDAVPDHAGRAAQFALGAIAKAKETLICPAKPNMGHVQVRFGLASGNVVATVIGSREHPKYTLFGNVVNMASRMESSGLPNKCQCAPETAALIREQSPNIVLESRGVTDIKGKGEMETFWLTSADS